MKIGLFGGTFDPPHNAHTALVATVLERKLFDQVWYLPVAIHQTLFAKTAMSSVEHRLAMLKLVQTSQTQIETFEVESHSPSHTHQTLRALQQRHPEHQFSFVMGSDQLPKLHLWNCDTDVQCFPAAASEFSYYVYPRLGFPMELPYSNLHIIEDVEPIALSSTQVREAVAAGVSITNYVSPSVADYIAAHRLYFSVGR